jgi:hypothetical protein
MLWDPALFVFLYYRSLAERERAALREQRHRVIEGLPDPPKQAPKPTRTAAERAQAIWWSRRASTRRPRSTGAALAEVIKIPRR